MRKYVQVLLILLSCFSLLLFLIYRHEYNRLRYVLEVLNFFGSPVSPITTNTTNCLTSVTSLSQRQPLENISPSWQRVSNAVFIYSAFWVTIVSKPTVLAIAVGNLLNDNMNYGCKLWYDDKDFPLKGIFSFSAIPRRKNNAKIVSKQKAYYFNCEPTNTESLPIGVTFYKTPGEEWFGFIPITKVNVREPDWHQTAICVMPSDKALADVNQLKEFITFHKTLGVSDFYVYGRGNTLNLLSSVYTTIKINARPLIWNFPFNSDAELMRVIAESDCLWRTRGHFHNVPILGSHQFLVPRYHSNISRLIRDFDPEDKFSKFQLQSLIFCTEYEDDTQSAADSPVFLRKTKFTNLKSDATVLVHKPEIVGRKIQKISRDIAAVHWYTSCKGLDVQNTDLKTDRSVKRFSSDLQVTQFAIIQDAL